MIAPHIPDPETEPAASLVEQLSQFIESMSLMSPEQMVNARSVALGLMMIRLTARRLALDEQARSHPLLPEEAKHL
jgi:hypothetical protein